MGTNLLSSMEIDAIGEILNISLGASATAVSTMLDARVDITTPVVSVVSKEEFSFERLEPAVGVEITYVEGLEGKNVMLLKKDDVRIIVDMLMGVDTPPDEFELNEMSISAICEVMNQMMGASATALSELLGRTVNISTPHSEEIQNGEDFKEKSFYGNERMVVVHFNLHIADRLESEFMNLMPVELAKELVAGMFPDGVPQEEKNTDAGKDAGINEKQGKKMLEETSAPDTRDNRKAAMEEAPPYNEDPSTDLMQSRKTVAIPEDADTMKEKTGISNESTRMQELDRMQTIMQEQIRLMQQMQQQMTEVAKPKQISVHSAPSPNLHEAGTGAGEEVNMDLVLGVPVEVSVEIGRTRKYVKDVLELNKGSLVVLDKLAGDQVDLFVNGQCIARGDAVVVNDNFGIRITEILQENLEVSM